MPPPKYPATRPRLTPTTRAISDRDDSDAERHPRADEDAAEDVAAELVGAQQMLGARRFQLDPERLVVRRVGSDQHGRDDRDHDQDGDDHQPGHAPRGRATSRRAASRHSPADDAFDPVQLRLERDWTLGAVTATAG